MELYNNVKNARKSRQSPEAQDRLSRLGKASRKAMTGEEDVPEEESRTGMPSFPQEREEQQEEGTMDKLTGFMKKVKDKMSEGLGLDGPSYEEQVSRAFKGADKRTKKAK